MKKGYKLLFAAIVVMLAFSPAMSQTPVVIDGVKYVFEDGHASIDVSSGAQGSIELQDSVETEYGVKWAVKTIKADAFKGCTGLTGLKLPKVLNRIEARAFSGCTALSNVVMSDSVIVVGERAFENCKALSTLALPDTLKNIADGAFSGSGLTAINIPAHVSNIGSGAFSYCDKMAAITVSAGNTTYSSPAGSNAVFHKATLVVGCMTTIIPNDTKAIGKGAFEGCKGLTAIVIPGSVTAIADDVFKGCTSLARVEIPASMYQMGAAFVGCTALNTMVCRTKDVLPVTEKTFEGAASRFIVFVDQKLVEKYLAHSVWSHMTIVGFIPGDANGDKAVNVADVMEDVNVVTGARSKTIDTNGADITGDNQIDKADIEAIAALLKTDEYPVVKAQKPSDTEKLTAAAVEVAPGATGQVPVTLTGAKAYTAFQFDLTLPSGFTLAGTEAGELLGSQTVTTSKLSDNIIRIIWYSPTKQTLTANSGVLLQLNISKAANIKTTESLSISNVVFADASAQATVMPNSTFDVTQPPIVPVVVKTTEGVDLTLMPVELGATTCTVGNGKQTAVDAGTTGIVTIPAAANGLTVTAIAAEAFAGCTNLTSVVIPEGVTTIGSKAFKNCTALSSVTLPSTMKSIAIDAFDGCSALVLGVTLEQTGLVNVDVKLNLIGINNKDIEKLNIPKNVVNIEPHLTANLTKLTTITVDAANPNYDSRSECNAIIEKSTGTLVAGCSTTLLPTDAKAIGPWAFEGQTAITSVTLHSGIRSIGEGAYYGCTAIKAVTLEMETPPTITKNTFSDVVYNTATLTIQNTLSRTRIMGTPWEDFLNINVLHVEPGDEDSPTYVVISEEQKTCQVGNGTESAIKNSTRGSVTIPSVNDQGYRVTALAARAFFGCDHITSVVLPDGITSIGAEAFKGCVSMTTLVLPASVTSIASDAFAGCTSLTITCTVAQMSLIKGNVKVIVTGTAPTSTKSLVITAQVISLSNGLTSNCTKLTSLSVESGNTVYSSPENCNAVIHTASNTLIAGCKNTFIPTYITTIAPHAFEGQSGLTKIEIPASVTNIGEGAFNGCTGLTLITLVGTIPPYLTGTVFSSEVYGKAKLSIASNLVRTRLSGTEWEKFTNIEVRENETPPADDNTITYVNDDSNKTCTVGNGTAPCIGTSVSGTLIIPVTQNGYKVTAIAALAFQDCSKLTSVVIPEGVTTIGRQAFLNCSGLTSITLPSTVTSIAEGAFVGCTNLTKITMLGTIPPRLIGTVFSSEVYGKATLSLANLLVRTRIAGSEWESFVSIEIRENETPPDNTITYINNDEQKTCTVGDGSAVCVSTDVTGTLTIPATQNGYKVTAIAALAFQNCTKLTSVVIPEGVTSIGRQAFLNCTALTTITLPSTVTSIDANAFSNCGNLTIECTLQQTTLIKDDVKVIVTGTSHSNLASIHITRQVISLPDRLIATSPAISTMTVESGNTVYDSRYGCNAIIVKATNTLLFGCKASVIPADVPAIAPWAFENQTGLTTVTLLQSITSIVQGAFAGCTGITKVTLKMNTPPAINENTFSSATYVNATLTVPEGVKNRLTGTNWAKFAKIVEDTEGTQAALATVLAQLETDLTELQQVQDKANKLYNDGFDLYIQTYSEISETANAIASECSTVRSRVSVSGYTQAQKQAMYAEIDEIEESAISTGNIAFNKTLEASNTKTSATQALTNCYTNIAKIREAMKNAKTAADLEEAVKLLEQTLQEMKSAEQRLEALTDMSDAQILRAANQGNRSRLDAVKAKVSTAPKPIQIGDKITSGNFYYIVLSGYRLAVGANNKNITSPLTIPSSLMNDGQAYKPTEIDKNGFADCTNLQWMSLNSSYIVAIREGAFRGCTKMFSIELPTDVEVIERYALAIPNLTSIELSENAKYYVKLGDHLYTKDQSTLVRFLPLDGGEYTLPATLTDIVGGAFVGCTKITSIITNQKIPAQLTDEDAFDGLDFSQCKLSVPTGSGDLYRAAKGWNKFLIIEERHSEEDTPVTVTARSYTREYGDPNPDFEFYSEGAVLDGTPVITCSAKQDDKPGVYPIIIQKGTVKNFNDTYENGTLTVTKATLNVSVKDAEREYGQPNPDFELVYEGWKLNDNTESLMMQPRARCLATPESHAGEYTIAVSGGMDLCYDFLYTNGILTVKWPAGIEGLTIDDGHEYDIYTTTGVLVKRKATSLKDLRPGIYIVNGHKIAIK